MAAEDPQRGTPLRRRSRLAAPPGHRTLAEKAFEALHQAIITGELGPGERLPIEELAETLDMSPMPIREALRRLDTAGLVEHVPHRGARVAELSVDDLREIYEVRLALEPMAMRHAAERFDEDDAEIAREALARHVRAYRRGDVLEDLRRPHGLPLRVLSGGPLAVAAAQHHAGLGEQRALPARAARPPRPHARGAPRGARADPAGVRRPRSRPRRPGAVRAPHAHGEPRLGAHGRRHPLRRRARRRRAPAAPARRGALVVLLAVLVDAGKGGAAAAG